MKVMPYCPNCGVELEETARACPLCGAPSPAAAAAPAGAARPERLIDPEDREKLTEGERLKIAWEVISVSSAIGGAVVCAMNLFMSGEISWALYPLASLALAWVLLTLPFRLRRRPVLVSLVAACATPAFLLCLDLIDGKLDWSLRLGLPIALAAELSAALAALAGAKARRKGINIIAFALVAAAATCVAIESALGLFLTGRLELNWSLVVAVSLGSVAVFLLYLHHRVTTRVNLRKLFRL
jgi:peptidoglycan/LPS O-acetylase OafA/YrhL